MAKGGLRGIAQHYVMQIDLTRGGGILKRDFLSLRNHSLVSRGKKQSTKGNVGTKNKSNQPERDTVEQHGG